MGTPEQLAGELVGRLASARRVGKEHLAIRGGTLRPEDVLPWLETWNLPQADMPWAIWEHYDRIEVTFAQHVPKRPDLLERLCIFGEGGDLALRRDGEMIAWRFLGPAGAGAPGGVDFFARSPLARFWEEESCALLWGEADESAPGRWWEARVGRAQLSYPRMEGVRRVKVRYRTYSACGQVAFAWWLGLEGCGDGTR